MRCTTPIVDCVIDPGRGASAPRGCAARRRPPWRPPAPHSRCSAVANQLDLRTISKQHRRRSAAVATVDHSDTVHGGFGSLPIPGRGGDRRCRQGNAAANSPGGRRQPGPMNAKITVFDLQASIGRRLVTKLESGNVSGGAIEDQPDSGSREHARRDARSAASRA